MALLILTDYAIPAVARLLMSLGKLTAKTKSYSLEDVHSFHAQIYIKDGIIIG